MSDGARELKPLLTGAGIRGAAKDSSNSPRIGRSAQTRFAADG